MPGPRTVSVVVRLAAEAPPGATLRVRLEDVSRLDAPSTTAAEEELGLPAGAPAGSEFPLLLALAEPDETARYSVRAHVDVTGSGTIEPGDLLSTAAHPVLTHGHPDHVKVDAVRV
jgi:putative lipoprotein